MKSINIKDLGTKQGERYSSQEIVDRFEKFQHYLAKDIKIVLDRSDFRDREAGEVLLSQARNKGVDEKICDRFEKNMKALSRTIATYKYGLKGEHHAANAMRNLELDPGVEILRSISIKDGEETTECDAIVIAPYGVFIVEVKNFARDMVIDERGVITRADGTGMHNNLGRKMNSREYLIRSLLKDIEDLPCQSLVLYINNRSRLTNNCKALKICYSNSIVHEIRQNFNGIELLTKEQRESIKEKLLTAHEPYTEESPVDTDQIVKDYEAIRKALEKKSIGQRLKEMLLGSAIPSAQNN